MTAHRFAVGEPVSFSPDRDQEHTRGELFEIVRRLPEAGDAPQYRIKSQTNGRERVVRENQLAIELANVGFGSREGNSRQFRAG